MVVQEQWLTCSYTRLFVVVLKQVSNVGVDFFVNKKGGSGGDRFFCVVVELYMIKTHIDLNVVPYEALFHHYLFLLKKKGKKGFKRNRNENNNITLCIASTG